MRNPENTAMPPALRSPYPRAWWLAIPRGILAICFVGGVPTYPVLILQAIVRHTLLTTDRTLIDSRNMLWYIPLTLVSGWVFVDVWREGDVLRARRWAELKEPPDQYWRRQLVTARAKGDRQAELKALGGTGFWLNRRRRYDEATPFLEEALSLARRLGNQPFEEERAQWPRARGIQTR